MFDPRENDPSVVITDDPNSMSELLQELRIVLQGAQLLTGFLIVLPFSERFSSISPFEKGMFLAALLSTLTSLILFSAPAIHHRLQRPLKNRIQFKNYVSRMMVLGTVPLWLGVTLATQLAVSEIVDEVVGVVVAVLVAVTSAFVWWVAPLLFPNRAPRATPSAET